MMFFSEKISIFTVEISDDLFLVVDLFFRIFPFFSQIFRIFTLLNVVYDPFLTRKNTISENNSFMTLSRVSDNTTQNIVGDGCMGRPTSTFGEDRPPSPPRSPPLKKNDELFSKKDRFSHCNKNSIQNVTTN